MEEGTSDIFTTHYASKLLLDPISQNELHYPCALLLQYKISDRAPNYEKTFSFNRIFYKEKYGRRMIKFISNQ